MSIRSDEWQEFAEKVTNHINTYTVPQYGDKDDDEANNYTAEECAKHIKRYASRHGKSSRPCQEALDFLKMAHYAQMGFNKIKEQEDAKK